MQRLTDRRHPHKARKEPGRSGAPIVPGEEGSYPAVKPKIVRQTAAIAK
jgi:hypothetical protein